MTHTADEATLDGKIPSQDSVFVSIAKLKNEINPTYFVITARSYFINIHPTSFRPVSAPTRLSYAAVWSRARGRERDRDREIEIEIEREREKDIYIYIYIYIYI